MIDTTLCVYFYPENSKLWSFCFPPLPFLRCFLPLIFSPTFYLPLFYGMYTLFLPPLVLWHVYPIRPFFYKHIMYIIYLMSCSLRWILLFVLVVSVFFLKDFSKLHDRNKVYRSGKLGQLRVTKDSADRLRGKHMRRLLEEHKRVVQSYRSQRLVRGKEESQGK